MPIELKITGESWAEIYGHVTEVVGTEQAHDPVMPELKVEQVEQVAPPAPTETEEVEKTASDGVEVDSAGVPFNEVLHTGTKKKDGTWRLRKGAAESTGTSQETATTTVSKPVQAAEDSETSPAPETEDEEDEFAAFREAAASSGPVEVPARKWTDADIGTLCGQAAQKLGDAAPVKDLIGRYVPQGEVAHSRNIPADRREEFARALEKKADIVFG